MKRFFVDTFYLIALAHPHDQWRERVLAFSRSLDAYQLYTVDRGAGRISDRVQWLRTAYQATGCAHGPACPGRPAMDRASAVARLLARGVDALRVTARQGI